MPQAFIQTFGCQMNEHDSQRMREILKQEGYEIGFHLEEADLVLLNSCSVREGPENKIYSLMGRLSQLKRKKPALLIAVAGCVAQQEGENILKRNADVDMVFGTDQIFALPEMLAEVAQGRRVLRTAWLPRDKKIQNFIPTDELTQFEVEGAQASIAITKGCDNFCSFCIVPTTRGRLVSRELENILEEARAVIAKGAKEILLLGQNVNSYQAKGADFYTLLKAVADLPGLARVRFTSPHPNDWDNRLTDLMAEHPVICNSLHLPFQAGADRILQLMRRDHNQAEYLAKVAYLQERIPEIGLSADIIVGFPSETDEEFQETLKVMEFCRFHQVYAFKYSPRPDTKAEAMPDDVPREVKEARLAQVLALHEKIRGEVLDAAVGQEFEVLLDHAHPKERGMLSGRTGSNLPVAVAADAELLGELVRVRVTGRKAYSLVGSILLGT